MNFLPLNVRRLPGTPDPTRLYTFLEEREEGEDFEYRLALLVADENLHAVNLLTRCGFEASDETGMVDAWSFYVAGESSPFQHLLKEDDDPLKVLGTYLELVFPPEDGDDEDGDDTDGDGADGDGADGDGADGDGADGDGADGDGADGDGADGDDADGDDADGDDADGDGADGDGADGDGADGDGADGDGADGDSLEESRDWPTEIRIHRDALDRSQLRPDSEFAMASVAYGALSEWLLHWTTDLDDDCLTGFRLPLTLPAPDGSSSLTYMLALEPLENGDSTTPWEGATLKLADQNLSGDDTTPIDLTEYQLSRSGSLAFRADVNEIAFGIGPRALLKASGEESDLQVRLGDSVAGAFFRRASDEDAIKLHVDFPLIMAGANNPTSLALLIPLVKDVVDVFHWTLRIRPDTNLSSPVLIPKGGSWEVNPTLWRDIERNAWEFACQWDDEDERLSLGGLEWKLEDLVGDSLEQEPNVGFGFGAFKNNPVEMLADALPGIPCRLQSGTLYVPVQFDLNLAGRGFEFCLDLGFSLQTFRLAVNRLNFRLPASSYCSGPQVIDLFAFAVILPPRPARDYFAAHSVDGYLDLDEREFCLFASNDSQSVKPVLALPGNIDGDLSQRLLFEFQDFHPESWPRPPAEKRPIFLRFNGEGLSLYAKVLSQHLPNVLREDSNRRSLGITPQSERNGKTSEVVIVDNRIVRAVLYGELEVPGVDDMVAKVEIGMTQDKRGKAPTVHAEIDLDTTDGSPIASLSAGFLKLRIDDMRARMQWNIANDQWDLSVPVDASFMLSDDITNAGGLDDLAEPNVIKVTDLDLLNIHDGIGSISLPLADSVGFTCLDGMFGVTLTRLSFSWGKSFSLACDEAAFTFRNPGAFDVTIEVGGVHIDFFRGGRVKMKNPSRIGIDATIGDSVRFRGEVAWVDNDVENYFAAAGTLAIDGLPEAKTLLKIGSGRKQNGQVVPNIALYGSMDYEVQLFSGVVAKNFGAGIGINNRLTGIDERPNAEKLLARIDDIDPSRIAGWKFVERNGFYLSIVGTTIIASNVGGEETTNAYVASIVLSVDIDLNIVAAAKIWLASSVKYVRKSSNWSRPALVGAVAILPREKLFTAAIESRKNPAIESSEQLSKILEKGKVSMAMVLSPSLVDFHLKEVSYQDNFLGIDMLYRGSFRLAFFSGTLLVRAKQAITGTFERRMEAGPGGFRCRGDLFVGLEFGGLLHRGGIAIYGMLGLQIYLDVNAWITIGFSFTIGWGRWKKRISFKKTFNLPTTRLEIGLHGGAAFNESGQFGFSGSLSISVSICGYRLSISPSFAINEGVIQEVRGRVGAFEKRLEAYRRQLLEGNSAGAMGLPAEQPEDRHPRWIHYQVGTWHLLAPRSGAEWFTPRMDETALAGQSPNDPLPFQQHVAALEIAYSRGGDAVEQNLELRMPWVRSHWEQLSEEPDVAQYEELELTMAETVARGDVEVKSADHYYFVSDPRVEMVDREYWTDEDQALLPDYALPLRMKSAVEVLQSGEVPQDFNSNFGRLVEYLYWSQHAIDDHRHHAGDELPHEELEQRRAFVLNEILESMHRAVTIESSGALADAPSPWWAMPTEAGDSVFCGLVFQLPEDANIASAAVQRVDEDGNVAEPTPVSIEHATEMIHAARQQVQVLPPRQELAIDVEDESELRDGRLGRVVVKVPVTLAADASTNDRHRSRFLDVNLPVFSHIEVYRRMRGGEPVLVANRQMPSLTFLDRHVGGQPVVLAQPYVFTDEFEVEVHDGRRRFTAQGITAEETEFEYAIRVVPHGRDDDKKAFSPWQTVKLHIPKPDRFPVDVGLVMAPDSVYHDPSEGSGWTRFQLASLEGTPTPALVEAWDSAIGSGKAPPFEVWLEPTLIQDSGFFDGAQSSAPAVSKAADLNQVTADAEAIQEQGKVRVQIVPAKVPQGDTDGAEQESLRGIWEFAVESHEEIARAGYAYQFYLRPILGEGVDAAVGALRRLPVMMTKRFPTVFESDDGAGFVYDDAPGLRPLSRVEWIDLAERDAIRLLCDPKTKETPASSVVPVSTNVRPRRTEYPADEQRRSVGVSWQHALHASGEKGRRLPAGGVELTIRDRDDSAYSRTLVCQTMDRTSFQRSTESFTNDSAWRFTERERAARLTRAPRPKLEAEPNPESYRISQTLYMEGSNPALSLLASASERLVDSLGSGDWPAVAASATKWMEARWEFEKSPLNLLDRPLRESAMRVEAAISYLLLGFKPISINTVSELTSDSIVRFRDELNEQLRVIEELNPDASDFTEDQVDAARRAFLDSEYGKKLAGMVRRRQRIVEDVLAGRGDDLPLSESATELTRHWLPRGGGFEDYRALASAAASELGTLTEVAKLLAWFPPTGEQPQPKNVEWLRDSVQAFLGVARLDSGDSESDTRRRLAAAGIAAKGAGLTIALQSLEQQFQVRKWDLHRLPHHQTPVSNDADGARIPEPVRAASLLPDSDRQVEVADAESRRAAPETGAIAYMNLLERLGFAMDIAGADAVGQSLTQQQLLHSVREARLEASFASPTGALDSHLVFCVTPREADSEYQGGFPDPEPTNAESGESASEPYAYAGFSFVKLVVIPRKLLTWILRADVDETAEALVADWFSMRGIVDARDAIAVFARIGRHIGVGPNIADVSIAEDPTLQTGKLVQLRVTPLELQRVTLPHQSGFTHMSFALPDRRGRRLNVAGRSMSRYEPFVRWAEDLPRPQVEHKGDDVAVNRIITYADGVDLPIPLPVSVIPHPEKMQFAFTLPPAGIRSALNHVSKVRTGFHGYCLRFDYRLIDHSASLATEEEPDGPTWNNVMAAMQATDDPQLEEAPIVLSTPRHSTADVRMFRHQRLVSLEDIPYFYSVGMRVHGQYDGDVEVSVSQRDQLREMDKLLAPDPARRLPRTIAYRLPKLLDVSDDDSAATYKITVVLSRHGDLAEPGSLHSGVPIRNLTGKDAADQEQALPSDFLPDLSLGYHFYYEEPPAEGSTDEAVFVQAFELLLPWHEGYQEAETEPKYRPIVRSFHSDVRVLESHPEIQLRPLKSPEGEDLGVLAPVVVMNIEFQNDFFEQHERRVFAASCRGKRTFPTRLVEEAADGP